MRLLLCLASSLAFLVAVQNAFALPRLSVVADDTVIRESCEIVITPGTVIADANTNGVLHLEADDLIVRFAPGSELRGAPAATPWNRLQGIGIRLDGHRGVRLEGARVHGYFSGVVARRADGLLIAGGDFSDNYRSRLQSTPEAEDGTDWLFPHHNDDHKWREEYGGAVCIEASAGVTVRDIRVRRGQNGILLDRVTDSRIFDNDCSFLSGWGLALWRSGRNTISRNAFDFCVRGHVESLYNRGQDAAGILCFEQCNENVFAENSATHGGDGFFGFAGREALGEIWMDAERERLRRESGKQDVDELIRVPPGMAQAFSKLGCNRNVLLDNDFSYASAHGIEMTFSEQNVFARNRLVENAICGIWGGYSSDTLITGNEIAGNGGMAYGLERGGINMEHAAGNRIVGNTFRDNKCAIHLWWDNDSALGRLPGVADNDRGVISNVMAGNTFLVSPGHPFRGMNPGDRLVVLQLRDEGQGNVRDNLYVSNRVQLSATNAVEFVVAPGTEPRTRGDVPDVVLPESRILGETRPVGRRPHLRGRDKIVMDEWGPWDHESPLIRPARRRDGEARFEILGVPDEPRAVVSTGDLTSRVSRQGTDSWRLSLAASDGISVYDVRVSAQNLDRRLTGVLISTRWEASFFPWQVDPRTDLTGWRREAEGPDALRAQLTTLDLPYGEGGPRDQSLGDEIRRRGPGSDRFGMIAHTRLRMPAGDWRIVTQSDDGIRVTVDGRKVIENWTWHGPTRDEGTFTQRADGEVALSVEHFEIDGFAVLRMEIEPVRP